MTIPLLPTARDIALQVRGLVTEFMTPAGALRAVDQVDLLLHRGEILGLVGESGSGKSVLGQSLMRLLDRPGRVTAGSVLLNGEDLLALSETEMRRRRGARIAMIFQDPMMTLNPVLRIDTQMIEAIQAHTRVPHQVAWERAREALARVGIPAPEERLRAYPHQFSGGMRQRVAIAIALINQPDVIIADEPTTALDVTVQSQILSEVRDLCTQSGTALIWVTHDLALVSGLADRIAVMYAGRIIETGRTRDVIQRPLHPYTQGLLESIPTNNLRGRPLRQIPGMTPSLKDLPTGCAFRPRCTLATDACAEVPQPRRVQGTGTTPAHLVRCHHPYLPAEELLSCSN
jgi:peptide/nickel transport system ATP-binding protein